MKSDSLSDKSFDSSPIPPLRKLFSKRYLGIFLVLLFAMSIRSMAITRNLPFVFEGDVGQSLQHPFQAVERFYIEKESSITLFVFGPGKYPPGFKYILFAAFFVEILLTSLYVKMFQGLSFSAANTKAAKWLISNGGLVVVGRLIVIILALLSIYLVYRLGKELFGREVGLMSALFLSVFPQHVKLSQVMRVDICFLFFLVLVVFFSYKMASTGELNYYLAAGVSYGALFSAKYTAPFFALFLIHAHFLNIRREKSEWKKIVLDKRLLYMIVMIMLGILLMFPSFYSNFAGYKNIIIQSRARLQTFAKANPSEWLVHFFPGFFKEFGTVFTLLAFSGGFTLLFNKNKTVQLIVITPLLFFAYMTFSATPVLRWVFPIYPFMALWAAFLCNLVVQKLDARFQIGHRVKIILIISLILSLKPVSVSIEYIKELKRPDTRVISRDWVHENIPKGSVLATYMIHFWAMPPLDFEKYQYQLVDIPFEYYNINNAMVKDRAFPLDHYKGKGVQYFLLDNWHKDQHFSSNNIEQFPEASKSFQDFYKDMETNSDLVYMIDPQSGNYKGPKLEIFKLRSD